MDFLKGFSTIEYCLPVDVDAISSLLPRSSTEVAHVIITTKSTCETMHPPFPLYPVCGCASEFAMKGVCFFNCALCRHSQTVTNLFINSNDAFVLSCVRDCV